MSKDKKKGVKKGFLGIWKGGCGDCAQYLSPFLLGLQCNLMVKGCRIRPLMQDWAGKKVYEFLGIWKEAVGIVPSTYHHFPLDFYVI